MIRYLQYIRSRRFFQDLIFTFLSLFFTFAPSVIGGGAADIFGKGVIKGSSVGKACPLADLIHRKSALTQQKHRAIEPLSRDIFDGGHAEFILEDTAEIGGIVEAFLSQILKRKLLVEILVDKFG